MTKTPIRRSQDTRAVPPGVKSPRDLYEGIRKGADHFLSGASVAESVAVIVAVLS